ncbi:uncharacterized protein LOC132624562 [Lycium barbarum]|uniref:uncharacterized protein LOC132624562 n=1 Tax=Lycium barbarum TaxID=112863 RepID=UPI00293E3EC2|nr:uncharacterized protein LOC132624562 [Lycium barbarum]
MDKNWGLNDGDAVKIAILYFIHTYILSNEKNATRIPRLHFELVETGRYRDFPWGKLAFRDLIKSVSQKMTVEKKFYRLHGMPLAMQVWLYECCSCVDNTLAVKSGYNIPRILNWRTIESQPTFKDLMDDMFKEDNNPDMHSFDNIVPTINEVVCLQLPPLVIGVAQTTTAPILVDDDFDDFSSTPPHKKRKERTVGGSSSKKTCPRPETVPTSNINTRGKMPFVQSKMPVSPNSNQQVHPKTPFVQHDIPTTNKQDELSLIRQDLDDFKKLVKDEFNDLRKTINDLYTTMNDLHTTINDNFTKVFQAIKGNNDSDKVKPNN